MHHQRSILFYVLQYAAKGKLEEFEKLYFEDPQQLSLTDARGHTALHLAATNNHVPILEFIFHNGGGELKCK